MEPLQKNEEGGIDLMQIAGVLLGHFWIIVFSGILVGLCALIFTKMTATPTYTSSTKLYILSKSEDASGVTSSDLQLSATLAGDYAQLIKDRTVTESVISELGLSLSSEALSNMISVTMPNSGRIITISVTDTDPYMASKLVTAVRDTAALHIKEVMGAEAVNVVEDANIPQGQSLSNYKRNGLMGIVIGMAVAIGIIILQFMMNDTIRNPEDVKRYLDMSVLGSIPVMQEDTKRKKRKNPKRER
ncbi:MAG: Wzz/FepE/Etk N-terminal domain-containing protein [Eubacteriales bacterium]|nr:Wzz/FepE/Etk N-terminal domain-containing protein [Eubacteriales bacterium]